MGSVAVLVSVAGAESRLRLRAGCVLERFLRVPKPVSEFLKSKHSKLGQSQLPEGPAQLSVGPSGSYTIGCQSS